MTWQTEMTPIVRYLIGDLASPPTYTDARLQNTMLVSAQLVSNDVTFSQTYSVDIPNSGISPDPTTPSRDNAFITLVSLKTACIIANSELKSYSLTGGIKVVDGPSSIDTTGMSTNLKNTAKTSCEEYEKALKQYVLGNAIGVKIISGPYTQSNLNNTYENLLGSN